jgi:hypothetical protein
MIKSLQVSYKHMGSKNNFLKIITICFLYMSNENNGQQEQWLVLFPVHW